MKAAPYFGQVSSRFSREAKGDGILGKRREMKDLVCAHRQERGVGHFVAFVRGNLFAR